MSRKKRKIESELLAEMHAKAATKRGLTAMAEEYGFSVQYVWDVLNEKRSISPRLAERMGYRRIVEFERI